MTGPKTDLAEQLRDAVADAAMAEVAASDARDRRLAALHAALDGGVPPESIARLMGLSRSRIYQLRTKRAVQSQETAP